jgi:hypothetical protein
MAEIALQLAAPLSVGALFLYVRGIKKDVSDVRKEVSDFKGVYYDKHASIQRELGQNEMTLKALHKRLDRLNGG